jgi:hypothetical protein
LFSIGLGSSTTAAPVASNGTSSTNDDLLMLSGPNPFIQNLVNQSYAAAQIQTPMGGMGMAPVNPVMSAMVNPFQAPMMQPQVNLFQQPLINNNPNKMGL